MFKLLISAFTSMSLMFGAAETVTSQPGEPLYNVKEWSVQSWSRIQQQERSADPISTEEPLQNQTRDQFRDQQQDQLCGPTLGTVCEPAQDQLRDQTQDQLRLYQETATEPLHLNPQSGNSHGDGDGTCDADCTPAAEPGPHGNGH
ncbi:MAG: hypothetical protein JNM02_09215 [Anaerolineales bacterium]|nr:hypothetical protein [Anaerolineales bacterium]